MFSIYSQTPVSHFSIQFIIRHKQNLLIQYFIGQNCVCVCVLPQSSKQKGCTYTVVVLIRVNKQDAACHADVVNIFFVHECSLAYLYQLCQQKSFHETYHDFLVLSNISLEYSVCVNGFVLHMCWVNKLHHGLSYDFMENMQMAGNAEWNDDTEWNDDNTRMVCEL